MVSVEVADGVVVDSETLPGLRKPRTPEGIELESVIVPEKPLRLVKVIVEAFEVPA